MLIIYQLIHKPTGLSFIGQTSACLQERKRLYLTPNGPASKIDKIKTNWQIIALVEEPGACSLSKTANSLEQEAIDAFIAEHGRDKLLNKTTYALPGKETHKASIKLAQAKQKELGYEGLRKARAKNKELGLTPGPDKVSKACFLFHKEHGIRETKSQAAFAREFQLAKSKISALCSGHYSEWKGWRLPIEQEDFCRLH